MREKLRAGYRKFTWRQPTRTLRVVVNDDGSSTEHGRYALVTDLVPSEMACLASSPGRMRRTAVWISRDEIVDFLEYAASSVGRLDLNRVKHVSDTYWKPR